MRILISARQVRGPRDPPRRQPGEHPLVACGSDFVSRRDAFARAFDRKCREHDSQLDQLNACGLALRRNFGFPDADCPAESPLPEFDLAQVEPEPAEARPEATGEPEGGGYVGGQGVSLMQTGPQPPAG